MMRPRYLEFLVSNIHSGACAEFSVLKNRLLNVVPSKAVSLMVTLETEVFRGWEFYSYKRLHLDRGRNLCPIWRFQIEYLSLILSLNYSSPKYTLKRSGTPTSYFKEPNTVKGHWVKVFPSEAPPLKRTKQELIYCKASDLSTDRIQRSLQTWKQGGECSMSEKSRTHLVVVVGELRFT